jgi:hypothetical protein
MQRAERIQEICDGKSIRIFSARDEQLTVSFVETFRNCGKKSCIRCRDKEARPHGPYWNLNYPDETGKIRTVYVGRKLPELAQKNLKVSFADVIRYYSENENQKKSIERYQQEIRTLQIQLQNLFQELGSLRRNRRKSSTSADKFFRSLVQKYHPDRNATQVFLAEDVMKDINQLRALQLNER